MGGAAGAFEKALQLATACGTAEQDAAGTRSEANRASRRGGLRGGHAQSTIVALRRGGQQLSPPPSPPSRPP